VKKKIRYPPAGKSVEGLRILQGQVGPDNKDHKNVARKDATLPKNQNYFFSEIVPFGDD
jgi:hypothetical protein